MCIIPKSAIAERVQENTRLFDFELSEAVMCEIDAMEQAGRLTWKGADFDEEP
jgi:diketogulonate reductase-like aldo/keto reductase